MCQGQNIPVTVQLYGSRLCAGGLNFRPQVINGTWFDLSVYIGGQMVTTEVASMQVNPCAAIDGPGASFTMEAYQTLFARVVAEMHSVTFTALLVFRYI